MTVAALFVDAKGIYPELVGPRLCWSEDSVLTCGDARDYGGSLPVVAHPPCARWCRMAQNAFARTKKECHRPAWLGGSDGGCFASALASVRKYGGVLEHPAGSHAWTAENWLWAPHTSVRGWLKNGPGQWTCEVWQSAYGHRASKPTWLLYCGKRAPFELNWARVAGTHRMSGFDKKAGQPEMNKKERSATPPDFARELIRLAEWSRGDK